jgi:dephospho-CoA kinase
VGGIGSGKSLVARILVERGGTLIAADQAGHDALLQPQIRDGIVTRWGAELLDEQGFVDRRILGKIVFSDPSQRRELEQLVFPWIENRLKQQIQDAFSDARTSFVVLDAAIMFEAGWNEVCDSIVYIDAPREVRLERVVKQRGWTAEEFFQREAAQWPPETKKPLAQAVIDNSGSESATRTQVEQLLRQWNLGPHS